MLSATADNLLSLATQFDCGPLLPADVQSKIPPTWRLGPLRRCDVGESVLILREMFEGGQGFAVQVQSENAFEFYGLGTDGRWREYLEGPGLGDLTDEEHERLLCHPTAIAAYESLMKWRSAMTAEFGGRDGSPTESRS